MTDATTSLQTLRSGQNLAAAEKPKTMRDIATLDRKKQFPAMLEAFKGQIQMALPTHLTAERMARLAMTAFNNNPKLAQCEPNSVFASVILASQLGLELGVDGEAFLVPYKDRNRGLIATFIPGWKGYVKLVNNAKQASVWTGAVFKGDEFDFALGDSPHCTHRPTGKSDETKGNLLYTYSIGRVHGAEWPIIEVWPIAKVQRHLNRFNKVGDSHYANKDDTNFIAYARKVALLQVIKYLPKSTQLIAAQAIDAHGTGAVDLKDVLEGEWSNVAADVDTQGDGEGGTGEDRTDSADTTLGQAAESLAREQQQATESAGIAGDTQSPGGTAAPATADASPSASTGRAPRASKTPADKAAPDLGLE